ncbi:MAG TPA: SIR2 family protein [Pseudonocardiaceae bacterium]
MGGLITHEAFRKGQALSFEDQPYLKDLVELVCDASVPLTIVVGAGVSMNAGLRSWEELVDQMALQIDAEKFQKIVLRDRSDLMRKVEIILQLINGGRAVRRDETEIIRRALYPDGLTLAPGDLARSIAKLAYLRRDGVRLITTNFDTLLEEALLEYLPADRIRSFGLSEAGVEGWHAAAAGGRIGVMHVHGMVPQTGPSEGPVVLAESQFFRHGAEVRRFISDNLEGACSLFVGLSMSDPNVVGPLYDSGGAAATAPRFALTVPAMAPGAEDHHESGEYALELAKFMDAKLHLRTVMLRSYSQLNQVLADLSLVILQPRRYLRTPAEDPDSLVYSARMDRALDRCYRAVGCGRRQRVPDGPMAATLNDRLYAALHAPEGPVGVISEIARTNFAYNFRRSAEKLSLFLWLRSRAHRGGPSPYALNLVGMSAYLHREKWSIRTEVEIVRGSVMVAAQAVFYNAPLAVDVQQQAGSPIWRGMIAMPIVLDSMNPDLRVGDSPADILTVGAITLNSTHLVAAADHSVGTGKSIMTLFDDEEMRRVRASILHAADAVLTPC